MGFGEGEGTFLKKGSLPSPNPIPSLPRLLSLSNPYSQVVRLSVCRSLDLVAGAGGMLWLIGRLGCWVTVKHGS